MPSASPPAPSARWQVWAQHAKLPLALAASALMGAATLAPQPLWPALAGSLCLAMAASCHWHWPRHWYGSRPAASRAAMPATDTPVLQALSRLDEQMLGQLGRAVALSESSGLAMIERVTGLRALSGRLMSYLGTAQSQSTQMQHEIELNGTIVAELAGFVQKLPQQISDERSYLQQLVSEVRQLSAITETIRGMARQTEILSINAAIAAAQAGDAGRGFSVLAGEVRRLAVQSNAAAQDIDSHIRHLVSTVQAHSGGEFADRMRHNEAEAARLLKLTDKLDEGYLDMRQFYAMLLTAITEHNSALDRGITGLLDTAQYQDVFKQIVDRLHPAFAVRHRFLCDLLDALPPAPATAECDHRAEALVTDYLNAEAAHRDPEAPPEAAQGESLARIELF